LYGYPTLLATKTPYIRIARMRRAVNVASAVARDSQGFGRGVAMSAIDGPRIPPRAGIIEDARELVGVLRGGNQTVQMMLVALIDAVELEVWADGKLRRRARFLRDTEARKYAERLAGRLVRRGYRRTIDGR
jgi:hypothetical protein